MFKTVLGSVLIWQKAFAQTGTSTGDLSFFHISDIHYDPLGQPALYNVTSFCRPPTDDLGLADFDNSDWKSQHRKDPYLDAEPGMYGRYGCDAPQALVDYSFAAMAQSLPSPNFLLITGDFPGHQLSGEGQLQATEFISSIVTKYFPTAPVFPSLGNNDFYPDYNASCASPRYQDLATVWADWLPADQLPTFLAFGAYATPFSASLTIISINTVLYSPRAALTGADPCGQFAWLQSELETAAAAGAHVYIIGHIIPGLDTFYFEPQWQPQWAQQFQMLLLQYSTTVAGLFFGHIHKDEFRAYQTTSLLAVPSITPIYDNNPGYRVVSAQAHGQLIDYWQYYLYLWGANAGLSTWEEEYQFSTAYGLGAPATAELKVLSQLLATDESIFTAWLSRHTTLYFTTQMSLACVSRAYNTSAYTACLSQMMQDALAAHKKPK